VPEDARLSEWRHRLAAAGQALLDLFFPPRCPGCGRVGFTFCEACMARIEPWPAPACMRCGHPTPAEGLCAACRETPSSLDRIASSAVFAHPLRDAIHDLKYNNGRTLARPLGARMAATWRQGDFVADVIMPVPLHTSRLAERGYNQSALLARIVSQEIGVPIDENALVRTKATQQQAILKAAQRRENVRDAFACRSRVSGKRIVLVDDVCTTGSTLEACAAALSAAGAASVWAFTLARPRWDPAYADAPDADVIGADTIGSDMIGY
jgi:ComF family protein